MVAPYTGPFLEGGSETAAAPRSVYKDKRKYKQAKPIDRPLLYYLDYGFRRSLSGPEGNLPVVSTFFGDTLPNTQPFYQVQINAAYARLVGDVTNNAQLGATLAEGRQAMTMMLTRVSQLIDFTKSVRRLDFVRAARIVNLAIVPKGVSAKKSLANNWLEYSFGWRPLIQDLYNAADHLQNPLNTVRPKGRSKDSYMNKRQVNQPTSSIYSLDLVQGIMYAQMGCEIEINNPNLYLLNKLGLANPASVIWELIPFSFVVDWFTTVGEFLSSGTDFLGLTVKRPWSLYGFKGPCQLIRKNDFGPFYVVGNYSCAHMRRVDVLLGPDIHVRPARLWGWQRVANATSVLVQLMSKR